MINVYGMAIGLIGNDEIYLKRFNSNTTNAVGQEIPSYDEPIQIGGQFQAIESTLYSQLGLDIDKVYRVLYTDENIKMLDDSSSDRIVYDEDEYQALKKSDWFSYNGWVGVVCVRL